jgi:hypothetical protein
MAAPSYSYTLTNNTTADATQVMQNFNDILNGVSDGTKDLSIAALTVAGTTTLNGAMNFGNSSADDIIITGSLASTIPIKTTNSYNIGSATLGLAGVYFGNAGGSTTIRLVSAASVASSATYTLPDAGASTTIQVRKGVTDASSATAGDIGEVLLSEVTTGTNMPGLSTEYLDLTSLALSDGDWEVSASILLSAFANYNGTPFGALTTTSGNVSTNVNFASGILYYEMLDYPTSSINQTIWVGPARINISSTTTYYLKFRASWSSGTPTYQCRLRARRIR